MYLLAKNSPPAQVCIFVKVGRSRPLLSLVVLSAWCVRVVPKIIQPYIVMICYDLLWFVMICYDLLCMLYMLYMLYKDREIHSAYFAVSLQIWRLLVAGSQGLDLVRAKDGVQIFGFHFQIFQYLPIVRLWFSGPLCYERRQSGPVSQLVHASIFFHAYLPFPRWSRCISLSYVS